MKNYFRKYRWALKSVKRRYGSKLKTWWVCGRHYKSRIDPLQIIWISPSDVNKMMDRDNNPFQHSIYVSEVLDGGWDKNCSDFHEYDLYLSMVKHFKHGEPWENTPFYDRVVNQIESGSSKWNCGTVDEFQNRCERLDNLYKSIQKNGYRMQEKIYNSDDHVVKKKNYKNHCPALKEITVNIGRDGEYIFLDGRHRLSIAKILDIKKIPVRIKTRHTEWQRYRDELATNPEQTPKINHPDLYNLSSS